MRARHRLGKLLLRHDVRYGGAGENWSQRHRDWLMTIALADRGAQVTLLDYLGAIDAVVVRRDALERTIAELVPASPWAPMIARLRCLRGIDTLSAVGLCAEIGEWERFERAAQLMSFLGLVPSENSTGQQRRQGRSPRPARVTPAGCSSRPPGTTGAHRAAAPNCAGAKPTSPRT